MIRLIIADDQELIRASLRTMLEVHFDVVAQAATGDEAVRLAAEHRPDLVLMDVRMPGGDGLAATRRIVADPALCEVKVVILTTYDLDEYVYQALRAGAAGFTLKDTEPIELIYGLRAVARGEALLAPAVTRRLLNEFATQPVTPGPGLDLTVLTEREREVLRGVTAGLGNLEIAEQLGMRPATAKTHISRILAKLGARDRAQLVVMAYESGLVRPGWLG